MVSTTFTRDGDANLPSPLPSARSTAEEKVLGNRWIVNPLFDSLFVFGGALWIIFALQLFWFHWDTLNPGLPGAPGTTAWVLLFMSTFGSYLFADSHTIATYMRIYSTPENRQRFKMYAYYLPWCSALLFALCLLYPKAAGFCVYLHLMWVFQHYVGQTFGISLIYCYKRGYFFKPWERETYRWFMHSFSAFVISRILCFRELSPDTVYGVKLPFYSLPYQLFSVCKIALIVMTVAFATVVVRKYLFEKKLIPLPTVCLILTIIAIGLSTGAASAMVWVYGPPFFHGSQYLAVSLGFYLKEKSLEDGRMAEVGRNLIKEFLSTVALRYWAIVIMAGIFLYVGIPSIFENYGFGFVYTATIIQACINFHHFVTDGAIWRLRDTKCREILLA